MKPIAQGLAVLVFISGFSACLGVTYGGNCTDNANCTDTGQVCDPDTCQCDTANYYNHDGSNCVLEVDLGSNCPRTDACADANAECSSSNICVCKSSHYDSNGGNTDGGQCDTKVSLGSNCPRTDACVDANAECSSSNICVCKSSHYDSNGGNTGGGQCDIKVSLGSYCPRTDACADANAECSSSNICVCKSSHYDSNGGNTGGEQCDIKVSLGSNCPRTDACADANAECSSSNICVCKSSHYDSNGGDTGGGLCDIKVSLGSNCPRTDACADANAECLSSNICVCKSSHYDSNGGNTGGGQCDIKVSLGSNCPRTDACVDANTECSSSNICVCKSSHYDSNGGNTGGGQCDIKVSLGSNCPRTDACADANAECLSSNICVCKSSHYDSNGGNTGGGQCDIKVSLGSNCPRTDACVDANTECSSSNICVCKSSHYDSNGGNTGGGQCDIKVSLGSNCPRTDACADANAECLSSNICVCKSSHYDSNGGNTGGGQCDIKVSLGSNCPRTDACVDANTECSSSNICVCKSSHYDSNGGNTGGGQCDIKVSLGSNCPRTDACADANVECSSSNICVCKSSHYDSNGGNTGGGQCDIKVSLGSNCPRTDACVDANAECSSSNICVCKSSHYDSNGGNTGGGQCDIKVGLGSTCPRADACEDANAECSVGSICVCQSSHYDNNGGNNDGGQCAEKVSLGSNCPHADACMDTNAQCSSSSICVCKISHYDSNGGNTGGQCILKVGLGSACPRADACEDANAECSVGSICVCQSSHYDNNGGNNGGGQCDKKVGLGANCPRADACEDTNADCSDSICVCKSSHYDNNGGSTIGGQCGAKVSLGSNCPRADACVDANAECSSSSICVCKISHYDSNGGNTGGQCIFKVELGYNCPRSDACRQSTAECVGSVCTCKSDYYDDNTDSILNGQCRSRKSLEATCTYAQPFNPDQCSDSNALCFGSGASYNCTCNNGYYKNGSVCVANKALGAACFGIVDECSDPNAMCPGSSPRVCTCGTGFYRYNPTGENKDDCEKVNQLQVTGITFSNIQTAQFIVSWTPPSGDKASFISMYTVEWRPQDNTVGGNSRTITVYSPQTITGLTSGGAYEVKVISKNTDTQPGTTRSTFSSKTQAAKPSVTSGIDYQNSEKDASDGRITVMWLVPTGKVSGYKAKLLDGTAELAAIDPTFTSTTFSTNELKNGYRYTITIQAKSQQFENGQVVLGEIYSALFKTTPKKPNRPTDGTCSTPTDSSISLAWSPPLVPNGDLVQYQIDVYRSWNFVKTEKTGSNDTSYTIGGLEPGTQYTFHVYTENEVGNSDSYDSVTSGCKTKAKMSDKPTNLQITELTSRGFTIIWSKPNSTHSQENYGYILQIKDRPESCVEEIYFKCSDCTGRFQATQSDDLCADIVQTVSHKTSTELSEEVSYLAVLYPDITYTVKVAATNDAGVGYLAEMTVLTFEEAPQKPDIVSFSEVQSDSLKVTWTIADPRPGTITFEVTLDADEPAMDKVISVEGFENRNAVITGLQEYWNYRVQVKASTSIDSNVSSSKTATTLPAAPGNVSDFKTIDAPNDNYRKLQILWKIPDILDRNGDIAKYSFTHNTTGEYKSVIVNQDADFNYQYSETVDVLPEEYYSFEVFAINVQNQTGSVVTLKKQAVPGVPINIEVTLNIDIIPTTSVKKVEKRQFTVTLVQDFFEETTNGQINAHGLIACNTIKNCDFGSVQTVSQFNSMDSWKEAKPNGFTMYRVTSSNWLETSQAGTSNPSGRRKRETTLEYTVGSDACSSDNSGYCNGPLEPDTQILLVAVVCTNGGCLLSREYGPFVTAAEPEPTNLGMIIGIVVGAVVVFAVVGTVMFLVIRRRRRGPGRMKPALDDGEVEFTGVDPALAKIPRKRPIRLSEIEEYVKNMHRDSNLLFSAEYEELKAICQKHSGEASEKEENRTRNRYINIIPFDHSRVKLNRNGEDDTADYINANYLPGYNSPREYIGCQGPLPGTIDDFWRMVWEQNVSVVVMLTLCKEGQKEKCAQYWPNEVGDPKQYGDVIVEITSFSNIRTYDYRMFKITNGRQTRVVKHFHFLSWLDFQANVHHDIILDFIQHVRQHVQPPDTSGPMIIHCSAGVGRTGTYICLDHLIQFINEHDFDVHIDIFDMVMKLRDNRMHMVQTEQQYVFIHDCVKEIMDRKRRQMENIYENQAFSAEENIYQNENLYANVSQGKSEQNTEL